MDTDSHRYDRSSGLSASIRVHLWLIKTSTGLSPKFSADFADGRESHTVQMPISLMARLCSGLYLRSLRNLRFNSDPFDRKPFLPQMSQMVADCAGFDRR